MKWVVGIDEVGRGALAGPVVVAAALVPRSGAHARNPALGPLKDSKKLTARARELWVAHFTTRTDVTIVLSRVHPRGIERMNISAAANLAAERAFARLVTTHPGALRAPVFLDGGLFIGNGKQPKRAKTMPKADQKIAAVKAASIVAKVSRDRAMKRLAKRHPEYGFEVHKGYGTKAHFAAIRKHGPTPAHRLTFLPAKHRIKQ